MTPAIRTHLSLPSPPVSAAFVEPGDSAPLLGPDSAPLGAPGLDGGADGGPEGDADVVAAAAGRISNCQPVMFWPGVNVRALLTKFWKPFFETPMTIAPAATGVAPPAVNENLPLESEWVR